MTRQVRFRTEASAELEEAADWYESRQAGLGLAVLAAVDRAVATISRWPDSFAVVDGLPDSLPAVRRISVGRFPLYLAYLRVDDVIHVLAVVHERRRPAYWASRAAPPPP